MSLKCLFGHEWDGCKCKRCGKTRDEQHDWDFCEGKCKKCGKSCAIEHDWDGCKCKKCYETRHDWDGCKCTKCGEIRDEQHDWHGNVCVKCGKSAFRFEVRGSKEHVNVYGEITHIYAWGKIYHGKIRRGDVVDVYDKSGNLKFKKVEIVHTRGRGMRPDAYVLPDDDDDGYISLKTYRNHSDIVVGDIIVPVNFPANFIENAKKEVRIEEVAKKAMNSEEKVAKEVNTMSGYQIQTSYLSSTNSEKENCSLAQNELCRILTLAIQSNGSYTVSKESIEKVMQDLFHLHGKNACYDVDTYLWNNLPGYTVRDATMKVIEDIMKNVINKQ